MQPAGDHAAASMADPTSFSTERALPKENDRATEHGGPEHEGSPSLEHEDPRGSLKVSRTGELMSPIPFDFDEGLTAANDIGYRKS